MISFGGSFLFSVVTFEMDSIVQVLLWIDTLGTWCRLILCESPEVILNCQPPWKSYYSVISIHILFLPTFSVTTFFLADSALWKQFILSLGITNLSADIMCWLRFAGVEHLWEHTLGPFLCRQAHPHPSWIGVSRPLGKENFPFLSCFYFLQLYGPLFFLISEF